MSVTCERLLAAGPENQRSLSLSTWERDASAPATKTAQEKKMGESSDKRNGEMDWCLGQTNPPLSKSGPQHRRTKIYAKNKNTYL